MAESAVDKALRERREAEQAKTIDSVEQAEFLGSAIAPYAEKVKEQIEIGIRNAVGEPAISEVTQQKHARQFNAQARSRDGVQLTMYVTLHGMGRERDPDKITYMLDVSFQCRSGVGRPFGGMKKVFETADMYGPGRPGVNQMDVQSAIVNYVMEQSYPRR